MGDEEGLRIRWLGKLHGKLLGLYVLILVQSGRMEVENPGK